MAGFACGQRGTNQALGGTAQMSSPRNSARIPRDSASFLIAFLLAALTDRERETARRQQIMPYEPNENFSEIMRHPRRLAAHMS
jgi:hypothetical protein